MELPETNVPIPQKLRKSECDACAPGHDLLIGPTRPVTESHVFTVTDRQVVVRSAGLSAFPDSKVTLEAEMENCGEQIFEPFVCDGKRAVLDADTNAITVTASGRYRVTLEGADPEDVWVTQTPTDTGVGMGVGTYRGKV